MFFSTSSNKMLMFSNVADFLHFFVVFIVSEEEETVVWQDVGTVLAPWASPTSSGYTVSVFSLRFMCSPVGS